MHSNKYIYIKSLDALKYDTWMDVYSPDLHMIRHDIDGPDPAMTAFESVAST